MTEPIYSASTERLWSRLPEIYRTYDADNNWEFKTYISAMADQLEQVEEMVARLLLVPEEDYREFTSDNDITNTYHRPPELEDDDSELGYAPLYKTSDLVDPRTANAEWLPYVAQLYGVSLPNDTIEYQRAAIFHGYTSLRGGSKRALVQAVQSQLTGDKQVLLYPHRDGAGGSIDSAASEWDVLVVTQLDETPDGADIVGEVLRRNAKPAGVVFHAITYSIDWDTIETLDWDAIEAFGTWNLFQTYQPTP
jgi:hypothetical protein